MNIQVWFWSQPLPREHFSEFSLKHQTWPGDVPTLEAREEWFHSDQDTMSYCERRSLWDRSGATGTLNWEHRWQSWPRTLVTLMISQSEGRGLNLNRRFLTATHKHTNVYVCVYVCVSVSVSVVWCVCVCVCVCGVCVCVCVCVCVYLFMLHCGDIKDSQTWMFWHSWERPAVEGKKYFKILILCLSESVTMQAGFR